MTAPAPSPNASPWRRAFAWGWLLYAAVFLATLPNYGIVWDAYAELPRATAIVDHFLSGRDAPAPPGVGPPWSSITYAEARDTNQASTAGCLPSLVAAASGKVLFEWLGWLNPIDATHAGLAAIWLLGLLYLHRRLGEIVPPAEACLSVAILALSPRLFADAHNNMKDLPSALFLGMALVDFLAGSLRDRPSRHVLAGIFLGCAVSAKFTALAGVAPMGALALFDLARSSAARRPARLLALLSIPAGAAAVFVGHFPHLWVSPAAIVRRIDGIFQIARQANWVQPGPSVYAPMMAFLTTPPVVLLGAALSPLSVRGFGGEARRSQAIALGFGWLWIVAVLSPWCFGRLLLYDGIRNFEHYGVALAMVAAMGLCAAGRAIADRWRGKWVLARRAGGAAALSTLLAPFFLYHPYEITYFNPFAGGLPGATAMRFGEGNPGIDFEPRDYWGTSLRRCVEWANANLPRGARVRFGVGAHLLRYYPLRPDLVVLRDGTAPEAEAEYVVFLRRARWYGACDAYAVKNGTSVHSESILGVELSTVTRLPEACTPCMPKPLCAVEPLAVLAGSRPVVRLDAGRHAAGRPFLVLLGGSGFDPGTRVPWGGADRFPALLDELTVLSLAPGLGFPIAGRLDADGRATAPIPLFRLPPRALDPGRVIAVVALVATDGAPLVAVPAGFQIQP